MGLRLKNTPYFWNARGPIRWECYYKWFTLKHKRKLQKMREEGYKYDA